ncbi:hypothetical protein D9758_001609 [Tetrapyrgos nigripes]|uniref:Enoyl reductase (ER) domain-containing protein n=1 Tax=Tetrapyrgos nigripes TaxID=182062 RepID=A0A8H5GY13_9AGAR|nr:hypothetical protein D9758_001609 [Tetrapyrgos nigripes]
MSFPSTTRQYYLPEIGSYKNLKLVEAQLTPPKSFEVLVKIHAVSLQFRDLVISKGTYPAPLTKDLVPCSDMAGEIVWVGEDVPDGWKVGDRVSANFCADHIDGDATPEIQKTAHGGMIHGMLTEYKAFRPHSLVKIPDHLSFEEASTLPCAALTAYNALMGPVPLKGGDTVLVLGTGGVSIHALQIAVASGAEVIATSSSDDKLKIAKKLGAKHVINYKTTPDWDKEVLHLTNGRGVDHVIEVSGNATLPKSMNAARVAGWIHIIGFVGGGEATDIIVSTIKKGAIIRGIQIGSVRQFKEMIRLFSAKPEVTRPYVDKVFPFDKAIDAYAYLESQAHFGKVVIRVA